MASEPRPVKYADMTNRLFAGVIDMSLLFLIVFPIAIYIAPNLFEEDQALKSQALLIWENQPNISPEEEVILTTAIKDYIAGIFNSIVLVGLFVVPFLWKKGTTPGKFILGIQVVDAITYNKISLSQSIIRYIAYIPSVGCLFLGLIWGGANKRKRCWHDLLADTVAIYAPDRWYWKIIMKLREKFAKKD